MKTCPMCESMTGGRSLVMPLPAPHTLADMARWREQNQIEPDSDSPLTIMARHLQRLAADRVLATYQANYEAANAADPNYEDPNGGDGMGPNGGIRWRDIADQLLQMGLYPWEIVQVFDACILCPLEELTEEDI